MKNIPWLWLSVGLLSYGQCLAVERMEQIIVTGSYAPVSYDPLTQGVTIINRRQIAELGKNSLTDVLRIVAGVNVRQGGGAGGVSEVNLRGSEANFTLVIIDGVKVNDSNNTRGGGFNFNSISLASIERIEILRGVQTAVYGGDALAGVINIITSSPARPLEIHGSAEVGQDDQGNAHLGVGTKQDNLAASVVIATVDSGRQVEGSDYKNSQFNSAVTWDWHELGNLQWRLRYLDDKKEAFPEQSGGDRYAEIRELEVIEGEELANYLALSQSLTSIWRASLVYSSFNRKADQDSPGIAPFSSIPPNRSKSDYQRTEIQWMNVVGRPEDLWLNTGVAFTREDGDSVGDIAGTNTSFALDRENAAVFVEGNYAAGETFIKASLREDKPDGLSHETSGNISIARSLSDYFSIAADWGKGFKLPSFFALGHPLIGNPDLQPERATIWDIRLATVGKRWGRASLTYAESRYSDLIDFDSDLFTNVNRSKVDIQSLEFGWSVAPIEPVLLQISATWLDINTHVDDVLLSGRPEKQASIHMDYAITESQSFGVGLRYVGEQYDASLYTGETRTEILQSYNLLDANFRWQVDSAWLLRVAADNLLDEDYQEAIGFSAPGRHVRLQVQYEY